MCVCVVGERDGAVKVTEWQKTYYTTDSGIQSGATTVRGDDDGTEYSRKHTYTSTVIEHPAGEEHKHLTYSNCVVLYRVDLFHCERVRIGLSSFRRDNCEQMLTAGWIFPSTALTPI